MQGFKNLLLGILLSGNIFAQELNCTVSIIPNNKLVVSTTEQEILRQLEDIIREFMNNTKWTKDNFKIEERINCQIQFQLDQIPSPGIYEGKIQIQSSRPSFNSNYNSLILNYRDDNVVIPFSRGAMINYSSNQFKDNLTSLLAFYAYYIIGMDYDSFGLKGGQQYLQEAQNIALNASSSGYAGWNSDQSGNKTNRYWVIDNALHQLFEPLRECMYEYHRLGVDKLYDDKNGARLAMYEALNKLSKVVATRPGSFNLTTFIQAKSNEIKMVYADAPPADKQRMVQLLKRLDPVNSPKYDEILK